MKVVAFNGSPRQEGNTYHAIRLVAEELEKEGIEVEIVHVGNKAMHGCLACGKCVKNRDERCAIDDEVNGWIQKMKAADGLIFASPVHFSGIAGSMKCFLDRAFYVCGVNGGLLRHKVAAAVTAVRRSGGVAACDQLNHYISYSEMLMPASNYWNVVYGQKPEQVLQDEEGKQIMSILGVNMAWLLKLRENGEDRVAEPEAQRKVYMNFIR